MTAANHEKATSFFCGSTVDDLGLSAAAFRVLFHLKRRVGKNGIASCGIRKIKKVCDLDRERVIKAIHELESRKLIACDRKFGRVNKYRLRPSDEWVIIINRSEIPTGLERISSSDRSEIPTTPFGNPDRSPVGNTERKANPTLKVNPSKATPTLRSTSRDNHTGSGAINGSQEKPSLDLSEKAIEELIRKHRRLDVRNLIPEAAEKCALKYPEGGPMKRPFFEEYLDRCEIDLEPLGLIEGRAIKAQILSQASRDREATKNQAPTREQKRAQFVDELHGRFPHINVRDIAVRYAQECTDTDTEWDDKSFNKQVGQAQAKYELSWRESRTVNATA